MDEELHRHYVAEDRVNDEPWEDWRALFARELAPLVRGLSETEAALAVNRWCHAHATYRWGDSPTAGALTVYRRGYGRCGEESVFTVAALRAAGLAARQVYCPRWSHCDDNHAWVEVWADGDWHYLGACEPELTLNRGWFTSAAARAVLVRSRTFSPGAHPLHGAHLGGLYYNQTARYAPTCPVTFRTGCPVGKLTLYILNEQAFHPIVTLPLDEKGTAQAELGLGDVLAVAAGEGFYGEALCPLGERDEFLIPQGPPELEGGRVLRFRAPPPAPGFPPPLSPDETRRRSEMLARGDAARAAWLASQPPQPKPAGGGQGFPPPLGDRAVAATRLPCGDQLFVMAEPGTAVTPPQPSAQELLRPQPFPFPVDGPRLLVWAAPGEEPTQHLLNELDACPLPVPVDFQPRETLEPTARALTLDPSVPPLLALFDRQGRCVYTACGYRVGQVGLLHELVKFL